MGDGKGITVLDLFCGAGGFSEGFHMAGFDVVLGIDFWGPACETHDINGLGEARRLDLLGFGPDEVLALKKEMERAHGGIDVLIGSPPCTEFSYAKNGGKGDIEKGMLLVRKHLLFAALLRPRYWMMENVPRLREALDAECERVDDGPWRISYEKLGISPGLQSELGLEGGHLEIPVGDVFTASDFGTHENRKRFIAGDFPIDLVEKVEDRDVSLGGLLTKLYSQKNLPFMEDPNYPGNNVPKNQVRDHDYSTRLHPMYFEEMRHLKRRHIQYGRMSLPDEKSSPARTIMATAGASSREAILIDTGERTKYQHRKRPVYRQPTVREVACIQGFPLNFQLKADRLSDRYKLVGNAVPCQLSYALAKAISNDVSKRIEGLNGPFRERAVHTLRIHDPVNGPPRLSRPVHIQPEASDRMKDAYRTFGASPDKRLRRKLLSSKLENDSAVVVFENEELKNGKVRGGTGWTICLQKGSGKSYSRVYLDRVAVKGLIDSLRSSLDIQWKDFVTHLFKEIDKGIPKTKENWVEFPGYMEMQTEYLGLIQNKRWSSLPSITKLHRMFTEHYPTTNDVVGPLDLFDGLDSMMLRTMNRAEFSHLRTRMVKVDRVKDGIDDTTRVDPRAKTEIVGTHLPFVTIMAALLSIRCLHEMYDNDEKLNGSDRHLDLGESLSHIRRTIDAIDD